MKKLICLVLLAAGACKPSADAPGSAPTHAGGATSQHAAGPATAPAAIVLHARDVTIHGKTVRYEPEPHKNTIGYWSDVTDWVSWDFDVPAPGAYAVEVLQGCGAGSGGSEVELTATAASAVASAATGPQQRLTFTVEDTGHFQNFVPRDVGTFTFDAPGRYTLAVKPKTKPGVAVMDLRQVTLKPAAP
jgi:arylsulfatase A